MRENFVQPLGISFQKEIHHEAISHGNAKSSHAIQESNASNGVQFRAETKKLWPIEGNCAKLKRNFTLTFPDVKIFALTFPDAKIFDRLFRCENFQRCSTLPTRFDCIFHSSQTTSEDIFSEDEWLYFLSLGRKGERLVKIKNPHETELELEVEVMEAIPEDQHSQHAPTENLNAYRSMRDRMHLPRMSAPPCIVPPTEQLVIRPHIVPLLPIFHGMNPKFLKKFFSTHRTNGLKRQISNFSTKENEKFYECWERYMEAINACPHHGFDTWLLVLIRKQTLQLWQEEDWRNLKSPPQASSLEQAMMNLNKVVGDFVADQKSINDQFMQVNAQIRQENAQIMQETTNRDRKMDGKHNDLSQKMDNLQYQILRLTNLNTMQEKGKFPSQPHQNPKAIHESSVITLRSGKRLIRLHPSRVRTRGKRKRKERKTKERRNERTINQEEVIKKHMPPHFPQALHGKRESTTIEILEVLKQVKVNIPLLDVIKQVPTYAKFKDLCTIKKG
ncbi:hypothetical protein AAG906_011129 [Vitis piasezkii]